MSKSNAYENALMLLTFNNTNIATIGDATGLRGSSTPGNFYLTLCTGDPGEAGTALTNEISYTDYARVPASRNGSAGFTVSGNTATLAMDYDFPKMTGGAGGTVTHFGIVAEASGAALLLYSGTTDPDILVSAGIIPRLEAATAITED